MSETVILQTMDFESSESSKDFIITEDLYSNRFSKIDSLLLRLLDLKLTLKELNERCSYLRKEFHWIDLDSSSVLPSKLDIGTTSSDEILDVNNLVSQVIVEQDIYVEVSPIREYTIDIDSIEFEEGDPVIIDPNEG